MALTNLLIIFISFTWNNSTNPFEDLKKIHTFCNKNPCFFTPKLIFNELFIFILKKSNFHNIFFPIHFFFFLINKRLVVHIIVFQEFLEARMPTFWLATHVGWGSSRVFNSDFFLLYPPMTIALYYLRARIFYKCSITFMPQLVYKLQFFLIMLINKKMGELSKRVG